jgi:hypothetical protein
VIKAPIAKSAKQMKKSWVIPMGTIRASAPPGPARLDQPGSADKGPGIAGPFVTVLVAISYTAAGTSNLWRIFRPISESDLVSALNVA